MDANPAETPARQTHPPTPEPRKEAGGEPASKSVAAKSPGLTLLLALVLIAVGVLVWQNGFSGTALFHHRPNTVEDPVLDNPLLRSPALFERIFTGEFLISTPHEYRPAGYALFAVVRRAIPGDAPWQYHALLAGLHILTALMVYLAFRALLSAGGAFLMAALYVVHPVFVTIVNDINSVYFLWGLFFSAATAWLYVRWVGKRSVMSFLAAFVAFVVAAFTFRYAMVVPALAMAAWLFQERHPKACALLWVYVPLGVFTARILDAPMWIVLVAPSALMVILAAAAKKPLGRFIAALLPFGIVAGGYFYVASLVELPPIYDLGKAMLTLPFEPAFVAKTNVLSSTRVLVALALAGVAPLFVFSGRFVRFAGVMVVIVLAASATMEGNLRYCDDVQYFEAYNDACPEMPVIELNLATAYLEAGEYETAIDMMMKMRYEWPDPEAPAAPKGRWAANASQMHPLAAALLQSDVLYRLGLAYEGLGNIKVAGYYTFPKQLAASSRVRKHRLLDIGDFCFRLGYLSWAENHYASAEVMNPRDARVFVRLGKCMMYRNWIKAAQKHFRHALKLEPENEEALYYLAFIAQALEDEAAFEDYSGRWRLATGATGEMDFAPVYDYYNFDVENLHKWFSGDPLEVLTKTKGEELYAIEYDGKTYEFSEVPMEVGKYFLKKENLEKAYEYFSRALEVNSESAEIKNALADVCDKLGRKEEALALRGGAGKALEADAL